MFADAGLLCDIADGLLPKCRVELPGFDRLVLTGSDSGCDDLAVARALQLIKETTKAAILGYTTSVAALRWWRSAYGAASG